MLNKIALCAIIILLSFRHSFAAIRLFKQSFRGIISEIQQPKDSIKYLATANITGLRYASFFVGNKFNLIDSLFLAQNNQNNLAQILSDKSQIFMKSYGPAILASAGFRGGNSNHTPVLWNGFNLQSTMNGQTDFSLIPGFLMEGIAIQYGSPSSLFGSGAIGGAVHLQSLAPVAEGVKGEFMLGLASYHTFTSGIKLFFKKNKWQLSQKIFTQKSENDFEYKNIDLLQNSYSIHVPKYASAPSEFAKNSSYSTLAWVQEFSFTPNQKNAYILRSWIQQNERGITPALNLINNFANQIDVSKRLNAEYKFKNLQYELNIRYALLDDFLSYFDSTNGQSSSKSQSHIFYVDQFYHTAKSFFQLSVMNQNNVAYSSSYKGWVQQNKQALFGSYKWLWLNQKLQQQISIRQEWVDGSPVPIMPSYGFQFDPNKYFSLMANASRSYRLPTFNDLYWTPGGNANLHPESGWNEEISLKAKSIFVNKIAVSATLTIFNKNIENWIIWLPVSSGSVSPFNLNRVWARGIEADWNLNYSLQKIKFRMGGLHDLTLSTKQNPSASSVIDPDFDKQLIYIPRVKHLFQFGFIYKGYSATYQHHYIGTTFVSSDNQFWLNPYQTGKISLSKLFPFKNNTLTIQAQINNLFNITYQVMLNRPMPLRNYQLSINIKF